jgi:hypothetical protein
LVESKLQAEHTDSKFAIFFLSLTKPLQNVLNWASILSIKTGVNMVLETVEFFQWLKHSWMEIRLFELERIKDLHNLEKSNRRTQDTISFRESFEEINNHRADDVFHMVRQQCNGSCLLIIIIEFHIIDDGRYYNTILNTGEEGDCHQVD